MDKGCGPVIRCGRVNPAGMDSWAGIAKAFAAADPVVMGQGWLEYPQPEFRPAVIRCGWNDRQLLIYAVLEDADIFNPVTVFNEPAFQYGDAFEMFLRPAGQETYYEFHVTPQNQRFQLRIPSAAAFVAPKPDPGIPREWSVQDWQIESRVQVDAVDQRWQVLAGIPLARVIEDGLPVAGREWTFSFSRYDYTQGCATPVHSSTSPHKVLSYHRQQEWGRLLFV